MALTAQNGPSGSTTINAGENNCASATIWSVSAVDKNNTASSIASITGSTTGSSVTVSWANAVANNSPYTIKVTGTIPTCLGTDGTTNCCANNNPKCTATDSFTLTVGSDCPSNPLAISESGAQSLSAPMLTSAPIDPCAGLLPLEITKPSDQTGASGSLRLTAANNYGRVTWKLPRRGSILCTATESFTLTVVGSDGVYSEDPDCPWIADPILISYPRDLQQLLPIYYEGLYCTLPWYYVFDESTLPKFTLYAKTQAAVERVLRVASGDAVSIYSVIEGCGAGHVNNDVFRCSPTGPFMDTTGGVSPICSLTVNIADMGPVPEYWGYSVFEGYHAYEVTFSGYAEFKTCEMPSYQASIYFPMQGDDFAI